jgi:hypothetical protein
MSDGAEKTVESDSAGPRGRPAGAQCLVIRTGDLVRRDLTRIRPVWAPFEKTVECDSAGRWRRALQAFHPTAAGFRAPSATTRDAAIQANPVARSYAPR